MSHRFSSIPISSFGLFGGVYGHGATPCHGRVRKRLHLKWNHILCFRARPGTLSLTVRPVLNVLIHYSMPPIIVSHQLS